jgi:hypothetical protein
MILSGTYDLTLSVTNDIVSDGLVGYGLESNAHWLIDGRPNARRSLCAHPIHTTYPPIASLSQSERRVAERRPEARMLHSVSTR